MRYIRQDLTQDDLKALSDRYREDGRIQRLVAIEDFDDVKKGDKGGFIHESATLDDSSWVYDNSMLSRGAHLQNNSILKNDSYVIESTLHSATLEDSEIMFAQGEIRNATLINTKAIGAKDIINASIEGSRLNTFMHGVIGYQVDNGPSVIDSQVRRSYVLGASRVEKGSSVVESTLDESEVYESHVQGSSILQSGLTQVHAEYANITKSSIHNESVINRDIDQTPLELSDADLQGLQGLDGPLL